MRRQIPGCPIKHIEMSLSYFLSLLHLFITVLLSSYLFSLFHFLAILFLLYLPLLCVCECPSLILPPFFCLSATIGGVSEKNWTSPVKLVFCGETDGSLCVPDGSIRDCLCRADKCMNTHTHTHIYTHTHMQGWEDEGIVYAEAEWIFMSRRLLFMGKYTFKLREM